MRGQGFLADLCLAWEAEALRAAEFGVRVVMLRTGMVLEQDGGALPKMLLPFQLFAGGPIMPGTQWVSWIHRRDHIGSDPVAARNAKRLRPRQCGGSRTCDDEPVLRRARASPPPAILDSRAGLRAVRGTG